MTASELNAAGKRSKRVLVAEDDESLRQLITETLARKGLEVATAGNGIQALAGLMEGRFDAAVLDVVLPGIDGLAVLEEIRKAGVSAPVILTSGYVGALEEGRFTELGAARVFRKPFGLEELAEAVLTVAGGGAVKQEGSNA